MIEQNQKVEYAVNKKLDIKYYTVKRFPSNVVVFSIKNILQLRFYQVSRLGYVTLTMHRLIIRLNVSGSISIFKGCRIHSMDFYLELHIFGAVPVRKKK